MAASFRRLPQAHLPLSDSNFERCTVVNLDSYNGAGPDFVAAYTCALEIWTSRVCKFRRVELGPSAVQLRQQSIEVAEALRAGSVLQRLVLGQDVDEPFTNVVAVPQQRFATGAT